MHVWPLTCFLAVGGRWVPAKCNVFFELGVGGFGEGEESGCVGVLCDSSSHQGRKKTMAH